MQRDPAQLERIYMGAIVAAGGFVVLLFGPAAFGVIMLLVGLAIIGVTLAGASSGSARRRPPRVEYDEEDPFL